MARIDKYYGTNVNLYGYMNRKMHELGYDGYHNQFRIVCKAKSMAEANRKAEAYGLGEKVFRSAYTSETGNELQIELCDEYGFIVCLGGTQGNEYIGIESIIQKSISDFAN